MIKVKPTTATYLGSLCKRGHDAGGGNSLRYKHKRSNACVECTRSRIGYITEWQKNNRDKRAEICSRWKKNNLANGSANAMKRFATQLSATPKWANKKYVDLFYVIAKEEEARTGRKCQVDHMVPLRSKIVCGLHNEFNLQVMFAKDNNSKGNRYWPDMPEGV